MIVIQYLTITLPPSHHHTLADSQTVFNDDIIVILLLGYFLHAGKVPATCFRKKVVAETHENKFHTYYGRKKKWPEFACELSSS